MAARAVPADLVLRPIAEGDVAALQTLLESDPGYTERVTGSPPGPADALSLLIGRPEGACEDDKLVLGGWLGDDLVCVVDVLELLDAGRHLLPARSRPGASRGWVGSPAVRLTH